MRLTPAQEMHLSNVRKADERWRTAQKDALSRAKIIAAQEVAVYLADRDKEVRLAVEAGVPKVRIREDGLLTTSPKTLNDSLARTAEQAARAELVGIATDPFAGRYWRTEDDPTALVVTLDGVALETACADADWSVADAIGAGVTTAMFEIAHRTDGTMFLTAVTPSFLPEHGNVHPVVQWARQPENEAEALAWVREKVAA